MKTAITSRSALACLICLCGSASAASAGPDDTFTIESTLTGGYQADGKFSNSIPGQNYRVGHSPITTDPERRNFFIFDLTSIVIPPGSIASATIKLYVPKFAPGITLDPGDGYISPDPFEVYRLSSTPFSASELADPTNSVSTATAIFGTLGTGTLAGESVVSPADKGTFLEIELVPAAIMAIEAKAGSGTVEFGGRLMSLSFIPPDELVFGFTDLSAPHMMGKKPTLEITLVPAPGSMALGVAAVAVGMRRRRAR